jgi:hypothetical protein
MRGGGDGKWYAIEASGASVQGSETRGRQHTRLESFKASFYLPSSLESPFPGGRISTFQGYLEMGIQTPMARGRYTKNITGTEPVGCQ